MSRSQPDFNQSITAHCFLPANDSLLHKDVIYYQKPTHSDIKYLPIFFNRYKVHFIDYLFENEKCIS